MKTSKYKKGNISATTDWILLKFETLAYGNRWKLKIAYNVDDSNWKTT